MHVGAAQRGWSGVLATAIATLLAHLRDCGWALMRRRGALKLGEKVRFSMVESLLLTVLVVLAVRL